MLTRRSGGAAELLDLGTSELKHALKRRGLDTTGSFDKQSLLELGAGAGVLPEEFGSGSSPSRPRRRRRLRDEDEPPPIVVALRRMGEDGYLPIGLFTDGERIALPLWWDEEPTAAPMWFLLDSAMPRSAISFSTASRLDVVKQGNVASGLHFAGAPVGDLEVTTVPDDSAVLGPKKAGIAGLLGLDFLHRFDLDLDIARGRCAAWPVGKEVVRGFGPRDAVEIKLTGDQGLLELGAHLRGTVCSGSETSGPMVRAVIDFGQTYSACNWAAARQVGVNGPNSPCVRKAGEWMDMDGKPIEVCEADLGVELPGRVAGVMSGARVCENRLFWLAEKLPLLQSFGLDPREPCAVLGLDTIGRGRIAVSAKHRVLWLPQ